ncbi:MAG: hypothetical protein V7606_4567, partial [Burkholderiales bacterium]
ERAIASGCLMGTYERSDGSIKVGVAEPVTAGIRSDTSLI